MILLQILGRGDESQVIFFFNEEKNELVRIAWLNKCSRSIESPFKQRQPQQTHQIHWTVLGVWIELAQALELVATIWEAKQ